MGLIGLWVGLEVIKICLFVSGFVDSVVLMVVMILSGLDMWFGLNLL